MSRFIPDKIQQKIIDFYGGYALVLAAPGCGKTEILSHRILKGHSEYGIAYKDMLCITFTNRASREMKERIIETLGEHPDDLFVGNLHRFCIRFLYDNEIVPIDTGILDDVDQEILISEFFGENTNKGMVQNVLNLASAIREETLGIPQNLWIFHQRITSFVLDSYCYKYAYQYLEFLKENKLMDFDDILFKAYTALHFRPIDTEYINSAYRWIQVDEVQDLNALQLAILDELSTPNCTFVYLGDERQSIYSFIGANHECVKQIEKKCNGNVIHLLNNYRSPIYLLDMLNDYVSEVIKIGIERLPSTTNSIHIDDALTCIGCEKYDQDSVVSAMVRQIYTTAREESVGILVRANWEANALSQSLMEHKIRHLKITNQDMFKMIPFKTIYSHFSVVSLDTCFSEWGRILYQTKTIETLSKARRCVRKMRELGLTPRDLLDYENSSYLIEFCRSFENKDVVVFDTETTGLDIFNDDIIQIAACKLHNGIMIPGSKIDIVIQTNKKIPATLKDGFVNPMVEEYKRRAQGLRKHSYEYFLNANEAFKFFLEYIDGAELLGHNSNYDVHILENNIKRRTSLSFCIPIFWDTLLISRLLDPNLRSHTLEHLIKAYSLNGTNSHNAIDDVLATVTLAGHCYGKSLSLIDKQQAFISHKVLKEIQRKLLNNYFPLYKHTQSKLYSSEICQENTFNTEFKYVYETMLSKKYIAEIPQFEYMRELFNKVVIRDEDKYFNHQLTRHLYEFRTFNEADLFQNGIVNENIHIMTIHKAKGLQFDNVFIFNVSNSLHYWEPTDENARVLYVAMSRARKRIFLTYRDYISPLIGRYDKVKEHFYFMPKAQKERVLSFEEKFVKFGKQL